jgi:hypothetical protein
MKTTGENNPFLTTYNLLHTLNFATTIQNNSSTATDNISVDSTRLNSSSTSLIINSLSDHDSQFITTNNIATFEAQNQKNKE